MSGLVLLLSAVALFVAQYPDRALAEEPATASAAQVDAMPAPPQISAKPSIREVMLRALKQAVEKSGLTVTEGSVESGVFTTAFVALSPEMIGTSIRPPGGGETAPWTRAEYRFRVSLKGPNAAVMRMRTEFRVWDPDGTLAAPDAGPRQRVQSSGYLERQFKIAFGQEIERVAHLLPGEEPSDAEARLGVRTPDPAKKSPPIIESGRQPDSGQSKGEGESKRE